MTCRDFRPDHNGECLNCDDWYDAHVPLRVELAPPVAKIRHWAYNDMDGPQVVSDLDILAQYFPWWRAKMLKVGKPELITPENCIEDFVVVHWAWEIPE